MTPLAPSTETDALHEESRALRALSRALLDDDHAAEDVAQDTWVASLQHPPREPCRAESWRAKVARNFSLRRRRSDRSRYGRECAAAKPESTPSTAEAVERVELHKHVVESVLDLDEPYRSTIVLRFWEDLPPRDVASRMGVPVATVRTRTHRALAKLRRRLDRSSRGRSAWTALLSPWARLTSGASTPNILTSGLGFSAVGIGMTKLKLAATIVAVVAVSFLLWPLAFGETDARDGGGSEAHDQIAANAAGRPDTPAVEDAVRERVAPAESSRTPDTKITPTEDSDRVPPFRIVVQVVDSRSQPIAGASVQVFAAIPAGRGPSGKLGYGPDRKSSTPVLERLTAPDGRCILELDRGMVFVAAHKDGVGASDDQVCGPSRPEAGRELVLAIRPDVPLSGKVILPDGSPAARSEIRITSSGIMHPRFVRPPPPVTTDSEGKFRMNLRPSAFYRVQATLGDKTVSKNVTTAEVAPEDIVLRLPGTFVIRGALMDPEGQPVREGRIQLWESVPPTGRDRSVDLHVEATRTDAKGGFEFVVDRPGIYRMLGSEKGHARSELLRLTLEQARPQIDVTVHLRRFASIEGTVRRPDGEPLVGARVFVRAESGERTMAADRPTRRDLFGGISSVLTATDGTFRITGVHRGTAYTLVCHPDPERVGIEVRRSGIRPDQTGVRLTVTGAQRRGATIRGIVVEDDTGDPVSDYEISRQLFRKDGTRFASQRMRASIEDGRFEIDGLTLGDEYSLRIRPQRHAPIRLDPIRTTESAREVTVRVRRFGDVSCRVVDDTGQPVVNILVALVAKPGVEIIGARSAMQTGKGGTVRISRVSPGRYSAVALRGGKRIRETPVTVEPGRTTEVTLSIPR